ncbi:MAG: class I SAM-dependent methyltransferase [Patescibacteria group bacterium]
MNDLCLFQQVFLIFELFVAIGCLLYVMSLTQSLWSGAPFVSSRMKDVDEALKKVNPTKGSHFLELGCGEGKVVCKAVKEYSLHGRGIDISPIWLIMAKVRAKLMGISKKVDFKAENILKTDMKWADTVYLYMMPRFLEKNAKEIFAKCKLGTIVISYVFDIPALKDKEVKEKRGERYYIYKI